MHPALFLKYMALKEECARMKIDFILTSVARTTKEQYALYSMGRETLENVNKLRKVAGLYLLKSNTENIKVTNTLVSKHLIDLDDSQKDNDLSRAFDIAILGPNMKPTWDLKINVNKNEIPDYLEVANAGQKIGLVVGAFFKKFKDYPHYEI